MYRFVLLTPPVPAAIATIAVEGPDVAEWISKRVALSREMDEPGRVYYGLWSISDRDGRPGQPEQVVVCQRPDGVVEVNTHGGRAVVRAIIDDLVAAGAVESGTLSMDASRTKLAIAAESALIKARTDSAAAILLDQHTGALRRELENIREAVVGHDLSGASGRIRVLLDRSEWGLHLVAPWRIVLAGPPNVGKSSLINALIGTERSIVHDQPGTTRDWVEAETSLGGWPVTITDTAGIRETSESIERQGVVFTDEQIQAADWIVLVVDATAGWQDVHDAVVASCRVRASCMVVAWNKVDHSQSLPAAVPDRKLVTAVGEEVVLPSLTVCPTSCRREPGVGELVHFFASELAPDLPTLGAPVPFAAFIVDGLRAALSAAESNDQARAELELDQLLS